MSFSTKHFPTRAVADYESIRPEIRSGDILMCSGTGSFSRMIQAATGSIWSHVAFVMRLDAIGRVMVLESLEPQGVRTVPLRSYLNDYDSKGNPYPGGLVLIRHGDFESLAEPQSLRNFGQFSVDLFGYPYDKREIARIALRITAAKLGLSRRQRRELSPGREYICSEYVGECYKQIGINIQHDERGFMAPADFARAPEMQVTHVLKGRE